MCENTTKQLRNYYEDLAGYNLFSYVMKIFLKSSLCVHHVSYFFFLFLYYKHFYHFRFLEAQIRMMLVTGGRVSVVY